MKKALVCGVTGQDGAYLSQLLLEKGYEVVGTSRDATMARGESLARLGIQSRVTVESMVATDFRSVIQVFMKHEPDEVYNLSGQSSVGLSFAQPVETWDSIAIGALNQLEAIRMLGRDVRFYNACSGECFGNLGDEAATLQTPFAPRSPYGVAKAAAYWGVANYREAYGLHACSGVLFNHESPLRPARFVTRKIVRAAVRIAAGEQDKLYLGDTSICRDWGYAPEYVDAMWRMLQQDEPRDFIIATGVSHSLQDFVDEAFRAVNLDWRDYVEHRPELMRPTDIQSNRGDPSEAERALGWSPSTLMPELVSRMVEAERAGPRRRASDA